MSRLTIGEWGDGLGLQLPPAVAEKLNLKAGDTVDLEVEDNSWRLRKLPRRYKLAEILDSFASVDEHQELTWGLLRARKSGDCFGCHRSRTEPTY